MKLELSDGMSNNSDFSNDSQNSQMSTADFMATMGSGIVLTAASTFVSYEGLNSGVPTRTTPTLTPTTLRSIEQTFIELQSKPESHQNEAGFVPPMVHSLGNNQYISASEVYTTITNNTSKSNTIWNSSLSQCSSDSNTTSPSPADLHKNMLHTSQPQTHTRRNMGGRKPNKDVNISPEEEERKRVRRERNKAAAARCRKRRVDHTNKLIEETEDLEQKQRDLKSELDELRVLRDHLEYILENHRPVCREPPTNVPPHCPPSPPDVKPYMLAPYCSNERVKPDIDSINNEDMFCIPSPAKRIMLSSTVPISKPNRPNSLNVAGMAATNSKFSDLTGIAITTPSSGIQFNFDSLMVGGTGLTPVTCPLVPNCSTQQRIPTSISDLISPESSCIPPKLVSL